MVEGARLESVYTATYRGFESLPLRHFKTTQSALFVVPGDERPSRRDVAPGSAVLDRFGQHRSISVCPCYYQAMLPFIFLIVDVLIALIFIAGPWVILARLNIEWPTWLKDGIVAVIAFVIWTGFALYFATQTILWLGFVP